MNPIYIKKLKSHLDKIEHENILKSATLTAKVYKSEKEGIALSCLIDSSGMVLVASHSGAKDFERALVDQLCSILEQRPIQEGREHSIIRLENHLRDSSLLPSGVGIIIPRRMDPSFEKCEELIRHLYQNYLELNPSPATRNTWIDPLKENWLNLPVEKRQSLAEEKLKEICIKRNLTIEPKILEIKNEKRLVLAYPEKTIGMKAFTNQILNLERDLREVFGVEIEIQMETIQDKNKRETRTDRKGILESTTPSASL